MELPRDILDQFNADAIWLFGSRSTGFESEESDYDFLVQFHHPPSFDDFMGLKIALEDHLGRPVDLLSRTACKPLFLERIESSLQRVA